MKPCHSSSAREALGAFSSSTGWSSIIQRVYCAGNINMTAWAILSLHFVTVLRNIQLSAVQVVCFSVLSWNDVDEITFNIYLPPRFNAGLTSGKNTRLTRVRGLKHLCVCVMEQCHAPQQVAGSSLRLSTHMTVHNKTYEQMKYRNGHQCT